ncbi:MAG: helix-turn-helix domain-containing protein [Bradymonadales bacterium]|nr:MAG: helix-turn-helix domain-containing protein [Bradymonadales bacterium]
MPSKSKIALPSLTRLIRELGLNIRQARLRRRLSAQQVAERAGMTRVTLRKVESGNPSVSLGTYLSVLHVLGLHNDIHLVAKDDELGRRLQDAELEIKQPAPKSKGFNV